MADEKEKVQLIEDEEIITLFDDDNNPIDFYEVAVVEYESELYALLQPVEEVEGLDEDEVVIFKIDEKEGEEEDFFYPVESEEIQEAVFEEFLRATASDECDSASCEGCASAESCDKK